MASDIGIWRAIRRLVLFQIKLFADAARDLLLSPISFFCVVVDLLFGLRGKDSLYERMMELGAESDKMINLFSQYQGERTIDSVFRRLLQRSKKEQVNRL